MSDLRTAAQQALEAEPVAGKVVAWGVFAKIDGEWQLQHPVFAGDEQGKVNAEFERASYSGPQPLEVRPLGVVTATAQQAEPAQEPVAWGWAGDPSTQDYASTQPDPVAWRWGYRSVTTGEMDWRGYVEIAAHPNLRSPEIIIEPLYAAPPQRKPLTEEEIDKIFNDLCNTVGASCKTMARAVEKAVWEKNHGQA